MTDFTPTQPVALPPLGSLLATSASRYAMTAAGAYLVHAGAVSPANETQFVQIGVGICLWVAAIGWSLYEKFSHSATAATAVAQAKAS